MFGKILIMGALFAAFIAFQSSEAKAQGKVKVAKEIAEKAIDWVGRGIIAKEVYDTVKGTPEPPAKPERDPHSRRESDRDCTRGGSRGGRRDN